MSEIAGRAPAEPVVDAEALKKAEEYIEQEEGASNKLRAARRLRRRRRGGDVGVPPVYRVRDRADPDAAPGARGLRALPRLPRLPRVEALPTPHHVVGLGRRPGWRRGDRVCPETAATISGTATRCRTTGTSCSASLSSC